MRFPGKRWLFAAASGLLLLSTGCDDVVLENPLPHITDDRIIGSWATPDGKLAYVIKHGAGQSYEASDPNDDDFLGIGKGNFYLAKVGSELFGERVGDCDSFAFSAPDSKEAPQDCWIVFHIVLGDNTLQLDLFDPTKLIKRDINGVAFPVAMRYGVTSNENRAERSADVLLEGQSGDVGTFLANYARGSVYANTSSMHRIG